MGLRCEGGGDDVRFDASAAHGADQSPFPADEHLRAGWYGRRAARPRYCRERAGLGPTNEVSSRLPDIHALNYTALLVHVNRAIHARVMNAVIRVIAGYE